MTSIDRMFLFWMIRYLVEGIIFRAPDSNECKQYLAEGSKCARQIAEGDKS